MTPVRATARVRITVEVTPPDWWTDNSTAEQILRQGSKSALDRLRRALADDPAIRVVGTPEVEAVVVKGEP